MPRRVPRAVRERSGSWLLGLRPRLPRVLIRRVGAERGETMAGGGWGGLASAPRQRIWLRGAYRCAAQIRSGNMGILVEGQWRDEELPSETGKAGEFQRIDSRFRGRITVDGSSGFKAEAGRYHLYVSYSCPWAHRTLIFRALKKLERVTTAA